MTTVTQFAINPAAALEARQARVCDKSEDSTEPKPGDLVVQLKHWATQSRNFAAVCRARVQA